MANSEHQVPSISNPMWLRIGATASIVGIAIANIAVTLDTFSILGMSDSIPLTDEELNGAKAAVLAMCAASVLFLLIIPVGTGEFDRGIDVVQRIIGALLAFASSRYWLISILPNPRPYMYMILVLFAVLLFSTLFYVLLFEVIRRWRHRRRQNPPASPTHEI